MRDAPHVGGNYLEDQGTNLGLIGFRPASIEL